MIATKFQCFLRICFQHLRSVLTVLHESDCTSSKIGFKIIRSECVGGGQRRWLDAAVVGYKDQ